MTFTKPGEWHSHVFRIVSESRTPGRRLIACDTCGITLDHIGGFRPVSQQDCTMVSAGAHDGSSL